MGVYGADYLRRAVIAKVGLGANRVEDVVYPVLYHDADGRPPTGDVDHVLHFAADGLPPADAFWSVTIGVTMRLYDPRPDVLDGSCAPPPLTLPESGRDQRQMMGESDERDAMPRQRGHPDAGRGHRTSTRPT
jgi:hypothetical protein